MSTSFGRSPTAFVVCVAMVGCGARSELYMNALGAPVADDATLDARSVPRDSSLTERATTDATTVDATTRDATTGDATTRDAGDTSTGTPDGGSDADAARPADATGITDAAAEADSNDAGDVQTCLDPTFGSNGVEQLPEPPAPFPTYAATIAVQPDGKIIVAGIPSETPGNTIVIARYNVNGSLDTGFGTSGLATVTPPVVQNLSTAIALQADGQILVTGFGPLNSDNSVAYVVRLSASGVLDTSFGASGFALPLASGTRLWALAVRSDGSILAVGDQGFGSGTINLFLTLFTSAGAVDTTFGSAGSTTTDVGLNASAEEVVFQTDGEVIVGGNTYGDSNEPLLARYTSAGVLDSTFGTGGVVLSDHAPENDFLMSLGLQSTGAIVVAAESINRAPNEITLSRFTSAGAVDTTFGTNGSTTTSFVAPSDVGLVVLTGDALSVGGTFKEPNDAGALDLAVVRYTASGALDTTFASGGMAIVRFRGETENVLNSIALGPQGVVIDGLGQKPAKDGGTSQPVLDLARFTCP